MIGTVFVIVMAVSFILGNLFGWQLNNMRQAQVRRWSQKQWDEVERQKATSSALYKSMMNFSKELEQSVIDLYKHPDDCYCAYCQIKYGKPAPLATREGTYDECPTHRKGGCVCKQEGMVACRQVSVADKETGEVYHPEFIRAVMRKNKDLSASLQMMQGEIDKRDRARAVEYQQI